MKVSTEVWLVIAAVAFLISYLIDRIAGPVNIAVGNPIAFLSSTTLLSRYPFTVTAIVIRTAALFISSMLIIGIVEGKYFTKAIFLFVIGLLSEFFAIQQLATGFRITTIQWTLSIAYGSLLLTFGIVAMILKGIWTSFNQKEEQGIEITNSDEKNGQNKQVDPSDKSVLEP